MGPIVLGVFGPPSAVNHHHHELSRVFKFLSRSEKGKNRADKTYIGTNNATYI